MVVKAAGMTSTIDSTVVVRVVGVTVPTISVCGGILGSLGDRKRSRLAEDSETATEMAGLPEGA